MRLEKKIAIVTGAAGGIGRAIALRMAESGAALVLSDLDGAAAEQGATRLRDQGFQAIGLAHDVRSEEGWARVTDEALEAYGRIDVLVNNAGIAARTGQPCDAITFEDWRNVMSVNLDGAFLGCQAAIRVMKDRGGGAIVNIGSIAGMMGSPGGAAYGSSKGAIGAMTKQMAWSCARHDYGIRINAVHPGNVWTDFIKARSIAAFGSEEAALEALSKTVPLKRIAEPDDVAWAVVYLASDQARMLTGVDLIVDGGSRIG